MFQLYVIVQCTYSSLYFNSLKPHICTFFQILVHIQKQNPIALPSCINLNIKYFQEACTAHSETWGPRPSLHSVHFNINQFLGGSFIQIQVLISANNIKDSGGCVCVVCMQRYLTFCVRQLITRANCRLIVQPG